MQEGAVWTLIMWPLATIAESRIIAPTQQVIIAVAFRVISTVVQNKFSIYE